MRDVRATVTTKSSTELTLHLQYVGPVGSETVVVKRSESRFGPYDPICQPFMAVTTSEFTDTVPQFKFSRRWYYRIEVRRSDGHVDVFPTVGGFSNERRDDPEANMLAGDTEMRLNSTGDFVVYFPVRTSGARCVRCYDPDTGSQLLSNCPSCFSTTFAGGFLSPVRLRIIIDRTSISESTNEGTGIPLTSAQGSARFPWYLDVKDGDVIVEEDNRRWRVVGPIDTTRKRKVVTRHDAGLHLLSRDASEYQLPVPAVISVPNRGFQTVPDCMR